VSRPAITGAPRLRLLQVTTTVSTLDRFAMPPMLVAIAVDLDVPLDQVVTAAGAYFLVYGLSQPVWGFASDRFGRVRTLRTTLLFAGGLTLLSALSPSILVLGVLRGLAGGFFGAAYPSTLIYVGDTVAPMQRQRAVAGLMVGTALGTAAASAGSGLLADVASWRLAFVITGLSSLLLVVALARLPEPERTAAPASPLRSVGHLTRSRITLLVLVFAFAEGVVLLGALTLLPTAMESAGASATLAGGVTGVYGVAVLTGSVAVGRLSMHWHPSRLIATGAACAVASTALLAASQEPAAGIAVAVLLGLAWTLMHSTLQTWATEVLPGARATVVSFFAGSLFVGSALGAVLVAGLADRGRFDLIYAGYAVLAVPLGVAATWSRARWSRP
jgi:predicted MFS family arabinose efflux permease